MTTVIRSQTQQDKELALHSPCGKRASGHSMQSGAHDDGMELLETNIRKEFAKPPLLQRARKFIREQYSPRALIPALDWIPQYFQGGWRTNLYGDVFAGLTVGAFLVPQGMSYALIAELPPIYGLYTASFPVIVYALLGTSRQLAVGPVAIVSLLIGHGISAIVPSQNEDGTPNEEYIQLCVTVAFFAGLLHLAMGLLKLGFLTTFLSHPVVSGFTSAAAVIIALGQAKHVLGFSLLKSDNVFRVIWDTLVRIPSETHVISLLMGIGVMLFLYAMSSIKQLKRVPAAMLILAIGLLISWGCNLHEHGVKITGQIPAGIPAPALPTIPSGDKFSKVLTLSVVITLLGYMESVAVGLTYASKNGYHIRPDQELIAFGAANVIGSLFSAYPVAGGFGRSAVNANSGAKTPFAGLISGTLMLVVLAGLTGLFTHLPKPVLGGIVIMAVSKLIDLHEPRRLLRTEAWGDLAGYASTFLMTLLIGVELGLAVGVGCSMLVILIQVSRPQIAVLGRVPHTGAFHDLSVIEAARPLPATLILRLDADLWFASAQPLKDAVLAHVHAYPAHPATALAAASSCQESPPQVGEEASSNNGGSPGSDQGHVGAQGLRTKLEVVILDFSGVNLIDSSALHELHEMVKEIKLVPSVQEVAIVGAKRQVRRALLRELEVTPGLATCASQILRSSQDLYRIFRKYDPDGRGAISQYDCERAVAEAVQGSRRSHAEERDHVTSESGRGEVHVMVVDMEGEAGGPGEALAGSQEGGGDLESGGRGSVAVAEGKIVSTEAETGMIGGPRCGPTEGLESGATVGFEGFVSQVEAEEVEGWDGIVKLFSNVDQAVSCPALMRTAMPLRSEASPRGDVLAA